MRRSLLNGVLSICFATATATATVAVAEDMETEFAAGQAEYMTACAACHGEAADGNGPIASMFTSGVPDLTGIAARNDGVFPLLDMIHTIDGRTGLRAHGNPMPVFGRRFSVEASEVVGIFGAEAITRGRVLELALYIQSIQE